MPPASYMQAAQAFYAPQQQADTIALQTTDQTTKNTLEAEKPQVQTDYESAIDQLTNSVQDQTGQINQLYSQRLGGNFSGLLGNDLGQMFSRANQQQSIISQTEANKLAQITTEEGNADIEENNGIAALTPKYQALEEGAAASAYSSDQAAAQAQANSDREYQLSVAKFEESENNDANTAAANLGKGYSVKQLTSGNKAYTGPNGQTNLYQYAAAVSGGDPTDTYNTILSELKTGSTTDKTAYNKIVNMSQDAGVAYLQKNNSYIFD